ncbi:MAG: HAMP domain-containing histidine kinase [Alkalinema sp. FL-bin-369]|nr:HAMP domain-containing histidine kinase [Leptolyngbyaceae cyanobacterium LF-bin-369]
MDWTSIVVGSIIAVGLNALRFKQMHLSQRSSQQSSKPSSERLSAPLSEITPPAYEAAIDLAQFKSSFLARTAHELRSPMNALISSLQLISADLCDSPKEEREYVGIAQESALKFIGLLDEVIKVSKLQTGTLEIRSTHVDLSLVLQEAYFMCRMQAETRNLKLIIPALEDEILVQADEAYLRQAIVILIDRAVSLLDGGIIELVLTQDEDTLTLTIPDPHDETEPSAIPTQFTPSFRRLLAQEILSTMNIPVTRQAETRSIQIILRRLPIGS